MSVLNSVRSGTDLEPEVDRFRRGTRPISARNSTDLAGERTNLRATAPFACDGADSRPADLAL